MRDGMTAYTGEHASNRDHTPVHASIKIKLAQCTKVDVFNHANITKIIICHIIENKNWNKNVVLIVNLFFFII